MATSKPTQNTLAFDFGAESGRAVLGAFDGRTIQLQEIHRFPNKPVHVGQHFHWNVLALWDEINTSIRKAAQESHISSIGIDTWAVDFALLDANDELIGNPYHYRETATPMAFWTKPLRYCPAPRFTSKQVCSSCSSTRSTNSLPCSVRSLPNCTTPAAYS